jgi:hypothetical protein
MVSKQKIIVLLFSMLPLFLYSQKCDIIDKNIKHVSSRGIHYFFINRKCI